MPDTIPDHVGREAVRLLNAEGAATYRWPRARDMQEVIAVAKLLMNTPAPMVDLDEEAAKRVLVNALNQRHTFTTDEIARATEQMRKEFAARKEAWEAGR